MVPQLALRAKVIVSGELKRKVTLKGLAVTKGARAAIEGAGGSIEAPVKEATATAAKDGGKATGEQAGAAKAVDKTGAK